MENPFSPGLHFKLPWPVDRVIKVSSTRIEKISIGNVSLLDTNAYLWTLKHGSEEAFLTGDNNFFYPYIILHYKISDPYQYLYNYSDPQKLLDDIGHSVARSPLFARESFLRYRYQAPGRAPEKDEAGYPGCFGPAWQRD